MQETQGDTRTRQDNCHSQLLTMRWHLLGRAMAKFGLPDICLELWISLSSKSCIRALYILRLRKKPTLEPRHGWPLGTSSSMKGEHPLSFFWSHPPFPSPTPRTEL